MGAMESCQLFLLLAVWLKLTAAVSDTGLQCPESLEAEVDETVILPCRTPPKMNVVNKVEWVFNDTVDVHLLRNGKHELDDQGTDFKEITSLFDNELASGNCSLCLKTKMSHSGKYRCTVRIENEKEPLKCFIFLTVRPRKGSNPTPLAPSDIVNLHNTNSGSGAPPGGSNDSTLSPAGIVGIVIGVIIGIGVIGIIILVIWKRKMRSEGCDGMRAWPFPFPRPRCCPPAGGVVPQSDPDDPVPPTEDGRPGDQENIRADEIPLEKRIVDPNPPGDL